MLGDSENPMKFLDIYSLFNFNSNNNMNEMLGISLIVTKLEARTFPFVLFLGLFVILSISLLANKQIHVWYGIVSSFIYLFFLLIKVFTSICYKLIKSGRTKLQGGL